MIEFKAECGHTIRAKDEDEGKVVRCSYCGREAQVPQDDQDDLDYLFSEVEASGAEAKGAPPKKIRRGGRRRTAGAITTGRADTGFNPLGVALKMAYVAALVIVLIVVAKVSYNAWTSSGGGGLSGYEQDRAKRPKKDTEPGSKNDKERVGRKGLLTVKSLNTRKGGVYVSSVPPGAMVRVRNVEAASILEIFRDPEAQRCTTNSPVELEPGRYEVAVGVKVNDGNLRKYPEYVALRRKIDSGAPNSVLEAFFQPDGADDMTTVVLPNQPILIVRKYEREVIGKDWTPLTAVFLPDLPMSDLMRHLPRSPAYGFSDDDVKWELEYYGVPATDRKFIIDALHRVGLVMYPNPGRTTYRRFRINLMDGSLTAELFRDPRKSVSGASDSARPPRSGGNSGRGRTPGSP
ncbi:MAG: hypothetical protein GY778_26515 [bacterium]|nr:hypothetical protein [bacterium]